MPSFKNLSPAGSSPYDRNHESQTSQLQGVVQSVTARAQAEADFSRREAHEPRLTQPTSPPRIVYTVHRMDALSRARKHPEDAIILGLLPSYAAGTGIAELQKIFPGVGNYLCDVGLSSHLAARQFFSRLDERQRKQVLMAVQQRLAAMAVPAATIPAATIAPGGYYANVLSVLDRYAAGEEIGGLKKTCPNISSYLTDEGVSRSVTGRAFLAGITDQQRKDVFSAIKRRKEVYATAQKNYEAIVRLTPRLVAISRALTRPSRSLERVAQRAKVDIEDLCLIRTESGFTELGKKLIARQSESTRQKIECNLSLREQRMAERSGTAEMSAPVRPAGDSGQDSHLSPLPSQFSVEDLEGYFDSIAKEAPALASHSAGTGSTQVPPEIVDLDNCPSPQTVTVSVAERLAGDRWMRDNDLVNYMRAIAAQLHGQPNADQLHFVDPQQVRFLVAGDERQRNDVLPHLAGPNTPPIQLVPVNFDNRHWSLLVVNRHTGQALHYDSTVPPEHAILATDTDQFQAASQVAHALGVAEPRGMPIAMQTDGWSCGDHVLSGIEELARRVVSGEVRGRGGMNLSAIRPNRERIVDVLIRVEQFDAAAQAAAEPQQPPAKKARLRE